MVGPLTKLGVAKIGRRHLLRLCPKFWLQMPKSWCRRRFLAQMFSWRSLFTWVAMLVLTEAPTTKTYLLNEYVLGTLCPGFSWDPRWCCGSQVVFISVLRACKAGVDLASRSWFLCFCSISALSASPFRLCLKLVESEVFTDWKRVKTY